MPREPLFPHTPKRREPLFPHQPKSQLLPQVAPTGTCYEDAWRFLIKEGEGQLVHGTVQTIGKRINHAWVETETGYIWEPESEEFMKKAFFYERSQPKVEARYTTDEAAIMAARTKSYGPWTEQERRQYLKGRPSRLPQVTIEGGEPIPPQYRHLIGWMDEPLPDYSLMLPVVEAKEGERKIEAVLRKLKSGVEGIQDSHQFRLYLTTMSKFHTYSLSNMMLIMLQSPDATLVRGFVQWKELGRWVKKDEKGIAILAPRFPPKPKKVDEEEEEEEEIILTPKYFLVVHVFDISQTDGNPLPEFEVPVLTGEANEELRSKLVTLMKARGVTISFESRPYQPPEIKGQYLAPNEIWVRPEEPRAQQLKTLLHESAHYYSEGVFRIPKRDAETIAESAAYVVGAHYGFDTGIRSFPYVALWAQDKKVLEENMKAIRRVTTIMLEGLEK